MLFAAAEDVHKVRIDGKLEPWRTLPGGMIGNVVSDPMPVSKKPCPYCGLYDGHDWDWRHRATISAGLAFFGVVVALLGLLTGADQLSYVGLGAWILLTGGLTCWFYVRR